MTQKQTLTLSDKLKLYYVFISSICLLVFLAYSSYFKSFLILSNKNNKILGWILTGIFIFLATYSLKKRKLIMFFGKLTSWYGFHFYLGLISIVFLFIHSGFTFNTGLLKIIVFLLFIIFINGIFGIVIHITVPDILLRHNIEFINNEELMRKRDQLGGRLDQLIKDQSESFKKTFGFYFKKAFQEKIDMVCFLRSRIFKKQGLTHLLNSLALKENKVPEKERADYHKLLACCGDKYELEQQLFLIRSMNNWLNYHISASIILFLLVMLHIFSYYYY